MVGQRPKDLTNKSTPAGKRRTRRLSEECTTWEVEMVEREKDKNEETGQEEEESLLGKFPTGER